MNHERCNLKTDILAMLQRLTPWRLWSLSVVLAVLLTEAVVSAMGLLLKGNIPPDYLLTGLVASLFAAALVVALLSMLFEALQKSVTIHQKAEAQIRNVAFYDSLTRLPNRRLLLDRLRQVLALSDRTGRHGALLFIDLDNFKTLNDTQGHAVGDLLLIETAVRLQACIRKSDTAARLGGDEFVVLLESLDTGGPSAAQAKAVGEKILSALAQPYLIKGLEHRCTASLGISLFQGQIESAEDLLKHADVALYQAKNGGRNGLRFFDLDMQAMLDERDVLENDLRHALHHREFHLYYQIQVNNESRAIGAEALLRWQHPGRGMIAPDQFLPLAEETGLIVPIGLWVLHTACAQIRVWSGNPATRDLQLAINVSPRQFRQPDFVEQVRKALSKNKAAPARLKIELTESLVIDNLGDTVIKILALQSLGVSCAMDDFGTGYSLLTYLKQLPLSQLKIDQSFVGDLATDRKNATIVRAIVIMGRTFGLNVIAEGVETEEQYELLELLGCHAFQGYLFSKPVPVEEFEKLLVQYE